MMKKILLFACFLHASLLAMHEQAGYEMVPVSDEDKASEQSYTEQFLQKRKEDKARSERQKKMTQQEDKAPKLTRAQQKELERTTNEPEYLKLKALVTAIRQADDKSVEAVLKEMQIADLKEMRIRWDRHDFTRLVKKHRDRLQEDFGKQFAHVLNGQWPFEPVWLALELVIASKKENKEVEEIYKKRLSIFKKLASELPYREERRVLRKNSTPSFWDVLLFSCCCYPCICACVSVYGSTIHRAVEADNTDALKICLKKEGMGLKDSRGWKPIDYAVHFGAKNCAAYLITKGVSIKAELSDCCAQLQCLTLCADKEVRELITDLPDYTPCMCCDSCCDCYC